MLLVVLAGLILWNEFARRTKMGGAITFFVIPVLLTVYFVAIADVIIRQKEIAAGK